MPHFPKPGRRFVEQMIYGIQAGGDVKLSEIARPLNERIPLPETETRLSRNLADDGLEQGLRADIAKMGATRVHKDKRLLIDPTDVHLYGTGGGDFFSHKSHQGSGTEIADSGGAISKSYTYDAFGRKYFETGAPLTNEFAYSDAGQTRPSSNERGGVR